ncbi:MAG: hypothetical protein GXP03_14070 [Alphaproteobacteria bacterium]|nr:hypothetical protein [Alphaproteobacteria bacterium]
MDTPEQNGEPANLRFLRILVTVLTATMIIGVVTIIALLVIRLQANPSSAPLPAEITLPDGTKAQSFTQGGDWYAIITTDDEILVFNRTDGSLRQRIEINNR